MKYNNTFEITTWKAVKEKAQQLNSLIANEINHIPGVDNFKVIIARYRFGDPIIDNGQFNIRLGDKIFPFYEENTSPEILDMMDYHWKSIPVGMVMQNSVESYIAHSTHIVPFILQEPGRIFSALSLFDSKINPSFIAELRSMQAGCRSLLMLSKLTNDKCNNRLKNYYHITEYLKPRTYADQWYLFKEIAHSEFFENNWNTELLLFSKDFFYPEEKRTNLLYIFLRNLWEKTAFKREELSLNFIWSCFLKKLSLPLKNPVFFTETVKHILKIALGEMPGYIPANSNLSAPIVELTKTFSEHYKIIQHYPVFMRLSQYDNTNPVYYSLQKHVFFHEMPKNIINAGKALEIEGVKKIFSLFRDYILNDNNEHCLKNSFLYKTLLRTEFDFYHPYTDNNQEIIKNIHTIAQNDSRFLQIQSNDTKKRNLVFPENALFFHGCIRIRPRQ